MTIYFVLGSDLIMPWELSSGEELSFPIPCQQMALCTIGEQVINQQPVFINLTTILLERHMLYNKDDFINFPD